MVLKFGADCPDKDMTVAVEIAADSMVKEFSRKRQEETETNNGAT